MQTPYLNFGNFTVGIEKLPLLLYNINEITLRVITMNKTYIFDLDGTLINSLPTIAHYANSALEKYNFPVHSVEKYKEFIGDGAAMLVHRMLGENDNDENFRKVKAEYDRLYESDVLYLTEPYDGIVNLIKALKERGNKIAVLSNKPHNVTSVVVEKLFGEGTFDVCFGQREGVEKKPAPDGVYEICKLLNITTNEVIFIGDTNIDIKTGKNAGVRTIGVSWGFRVRAEIEEAGADYIVKSAEEILGIE